MRAVRLAHIAALAAAFVAPLAIANARPAAAPIAAGAHVPNGFSAIDSSGKTRNLASITGRKGVVLVFFRSAKWCPYCQAQLKDLRTLQPELAQRGYTLAALSYDAPQVLADFAQRQGIGYTLLSDQQSRQIDAFGLRDPQYPKDSFAYGVPKASVMVINAKGVVRQRLTTEDYKIRPSNQAILAAVDAG